eukprot:Skav223071  [mRNA]  locus=scaffold419:133542:134312:- [translate_table: standard]
MCQNNVSGTRKHQTPRPIKAIKKDAKCPVLQHTTSGYKSKCCWTTTLPSASLPEIVAHQIICKKSCKSSGHMANKVTQKTGMHKARSRKGFGKAVKSPKSNVAGSASK